VSFKRVALERMVLSDGLVLPKGAYVCGINAGTVGAVSDDFDGFRYCKLRDESKTNPRQHMFTSTDPNHMTFGHGRLACPGRFLAAIEIKMMLASFIDQYELSFAPGKSRPNNLHLMEWGFVNPTVRVRVRRRQGA
jgi:cytochrome P450